MTMQPAEYIAHVDSRLRQEEARCDRFFERQSKKEVIEVVRDKLISETAEDVIDRGFNDLVKAKDIQSLRTLYRLLSLVKKVEVIRIAWIKYVKVFLFVIWLRSLGYWGRIDNASGKRRRNGSSSPDVQISS